MAWALAASGGTNLNTAGSGTLFTLTGGAASAGDLLLIGVSSDTLVSTPSGWTLRVSDIGNQGCYVFELIAAGGETGVTITTSGNNPTSIIYRRYTGALLPSPADTATHNAATSGAFTSSPSAPTGTLTTNNDLVVAFGCLGGLTAGVPTGTGWSAGFTGATQSQTTGGTSGSDQMLLCADARGVGTGSQNPIASWTNAVQNTATMVVSYQPSTTTTVNGTATLTGAGTLTAAATVRVPATATLTGAGTLTAAKTVTIVAAAALTGAGTLTAAATVRVPGTATLTGAGTLAATASVIVPGTATLTGAGTITAASQVTSVASASLTGAGTLTGAATVNVPATATLTGAGTLTAASTVTITATAALTGAGTLIASPLATISGSATLTGAGALTATPAVSVPGAAALAGAGALTAAAHILVTATATLTGAGTVTAQSVVTVNAHATLTGAGTLTATGHSMSGTVGIIATGAPTTRWMTPDAALTGWATDNPTTRWITGRPL